VEITLVGVRVTGVAGGELKARAMRAGRGWLTKPFSIVKAIRPTSASREGERIAEAAGRS
jgi:hypothetical protein